METSYKLREDLAARGHELLFCFFCRFSAVKHVLHLLFIVKASNPCLCIHSGYILLREFQHMMHALQLL